MSHYKFFKPPSLLSVGGIIQNYDEETDISEINKSINAERMYDVFCDKVI